MWNQFQIPPQGFNQCAFLARLWIRTGKALDINKTGNTLFWNKLLVCVASVRGEVWFNSAQKQTYSFLLIRSRLDWFSALIATAHKKNCLPHGLKWWLCNQASSSGRLVWRTACFSIVSRSNCIVIRFAVGETVTLWMSRVLVSAENVALCYHRLTFKNCGMSNYDGTGETVGDVSTFPLFQHLWAP